MHPRLMVAVVAIALAFGLGGCATWRQSREVGVSVVNLLPTQTALFETTAALTIRITNETPAPLTLVGSTHRLYLNGTFVGRAVTNERLTVPALATATQTVTVHLENLALLRKLTELSRDARPVIGYRLESQLHPADSHGFGRLTAQSTGELDVGALTAGTRLTTPAGRER